MTVYAVNMTHDDTSAAIQYGDIRYINVRYVYGDEIDNKRIPAINTFALSQAADDFEPERDFVLLAGDWLQLAQFMMMLGARYSSVCVLRWDKKAEGYLSVWV
jgi:hypothetical protein